MAIFNPQNTSKKESQPFGSDNLAPRDPPAPAIADFQTADFSPNAPLPPRPAAAPAPAPIAAAPAAAPARDAAKESLIAADITIEGKIEGTGHVRIAGRFKGDVNVQGDLTIEQGAKLNGAVRARKVMVAGELEGNIDAAERVELLDSAMLSGDLKAGTLTVAAGARIRGHIESGWGDVADTRGAKGKDGKADHDAAP